jgi:O-antigen/teichoic acid export membrane protein
MNSKRMVKMGTALFSGQALTLCTQFVLPPLFLHTYGVTLYGEWLSLSAAVNYLGTLNFGIQSYANNQASIAVNRNEFDDANVLHATAFAILLAVVGTVSIASLLVFFLPLASWLKLQTAPKVVSLIVYLLALQLLVGILFGFITGSFLIAGISHRGTYWYNARTITNLGGTVILLMLNASLQSIAALQLGSVVVLSILALFDLRVVAPLALPKVRYVRFSKAGDILRPSAYFGMLFTSNFFVYQLPVVLMQWLLGPASVVAFSTTRTIYSMSRSALTALSATIAPEIVELYGQNNWARLTRLYDRSERFIFALTPVMAFGTLLATPIFFALWLHKPNLYRADISIYLAVISAVMGVKEHKYQFQASSNQHGEMARFMFISYAIMIGTAAMIMQRFGIAGFLALWLVTELTQVVFIVRLNHRLFAHFARLDYSPLYRLSVLLAGGSFACAWIAISGGQRTLIQTGTITTMMVISLAFIGYHLFGMNKLARTLLGYSRSSSLQKLSFKD